MEDQEVRVLETELGVSSPVEFSTDYLAGGFWMDYMTGYWSSSSLFIPQTMLTHSLPFPEHLFIQWKTTSILLCSPQSVYYSLWAR